MATSSHSSAPGSTRQFAILWLDSEVNNSEDNLFAQQRLFHTFNHVEIFEDQNTCQQFIRSKTQQPILLIVSGRLSREIVPAIHSLVQLSGIYIYCGDESRTCRMGQSIFQSELFLFHFHFILCSSLSQIKGIITNLDKLLSKIRADLKGSPKKKQPTDAVDQITQTLQETSITSSPHQNNTPSHLDGYKTMPLGSLEDAVAPLLDLLDDVEQMVWIVKQNALTPPDGLTTDESASIGLFTMEWYPKEKSFYFRLNETLRSENKKQMKVWLRYLKLFFTALTKLKTVSHVVYQGTNEALLREYQKSSVFLSWEFLTCTAAIKTLEDEETFGTSGRRTLFTIQCRSGKDIRHHAFDPAKEQVLLLPGRQFQVTSFLHPDDDLKIIQLEELEPLYSFQ